LRAGIQLIGKRDIKHHLLSGSLSGTAGPLRFGVCSRASAEALARLAQKEAEDRRLAEVNEARRRQREERKASSLSLSLSLEFMRYTIHLPHEP
jgi:hypothetical protein